MNYYKFVGDEQAYGLTDILRYPGGSIICVPDIPSWTENNPVNWKELSKVDLLIEIHKGTPIFIYDGNWERTEL